MDLAVHAVSCRYCGDALALCFAATDATALSEVIECGGCLAHRVRLGASRVEGHGARIIFNAEKTSRPRIAEVAPRLAGITESRS